MNKNRVLNIDESITYDLNLLAMDIITPELMAKQLTLTFSMRIATLIRQWDSNYTKPFLTIFPSYIQGIEKGFLDIFSHYYDTMSCSNIEKPSVNKAIIAANIKIISTLIEDMKFYFDSRSEINSLANNLYFILDQIMTKLINTGTRSSK